MTTTLIQDDYLVNANVEFLDVKTKFEAIDLLLDTFKDVIPSDFSKDVFQKILDREEICSTGIGMGVALPHAKSSDIDDFHIAVGIHKEGIEWQSIDAIRVHYVFLIVGPEEKKEEYLGLLRHLSEKLRNQEVLDLLFSAQTKQDVVKYLKT